MEKNIRKLNCSYGKVSHTLKDDRALSKLITLLISNKKEFNHFFKNRSSDIVLLKLGNLHQNAKRYESRNTEREARQTIGRALILACEASCAESAWWECANEASRFFYIGIGVRKFQIFFQKLFYIKKCGKR